MVSIRLVLVDPKGVWEGLNNGLAYIASSVRNDNRVRVIDFVNQTGSINERLQAVKEADFVGVSVKSFTMLESIMVAKKAREINPKANIIAGGPHVIVDGFNFLKDNPVFDMGVIGEAETTFKEIVSGKDCSQIAGLIYRDGGLKQNPARGWMTDLDSIPFPVYDDFDSVNINGKIKPIENWPLVTSRGCPYTCTYCLKEDMLVLTDIGLVKIKDIKLGTRVLTDKGNWKEVTKTYVRPYIGKMIKIQIASKEPVVATPNHKIKLFRNNYEMVRAGEIKVGDMVVEVLPLVSSVTSENQAVLLKNMSKENFLQVNSIEEIDFFGSVYNLEVEDDHTYTVNGIAVSNCNVPVVIGRKFRTRSGKNIVEELFYAKEKYKSKEFKVLDDNFTLLMDRAKDICKSFIDENIDMKWTCPNGIRADRLDEELCKLMKEAGCYSMSIGIESGDPGVFDKIKKGEKLADVERGIRLAQAAGIKVHGFFIIGLIGSTYEADMRSIEFAKRLGISASWGILVPYPGTEVWEQIKADKNARILRDWKEGFHIGARPKPVFDMLDYTAEERVRAYYKANMSTIKKKDIPRAAKMIIKGLIAGK